MATVLVVDDDPTNREFLRTLLVHRGHHVCEAEDGETALALAGREPPDAVITDVLMPGIDGYELARLLRGQAATSRVPIAFSTAHYARQEIEPLARVCGVQGLILKPAHPREVLAAVDSLLSAEPGDLRPSATVEEFAGQHLLALKAKLVQKVAALGLTEGRLRAIVDTTHAGVLLVGDDGLATCANARLAEILGRPRNTLLRNGWLDCLEPSDRDRLQAVIFQGVRAQGCEQRVLARHGARQRWLRIRIQPTDGGHPESLVVIVDDVTDVVQAQQRLASAEDREVRLRRRASRLADQLSETQRVARAGTWSLDPRTGAVELSAGLRETLRLPSSAIHQDLLWQRVHPEDVERAKAMIERTMRTGCPETVELRVADLDGVVHELVISCRISAVRPSQGLPARTVWGVTHDVTEAREERIRLQLRADWQAQRRVLERMQLAMFPRELPEVPGVELAAAYETAPDRLDIGGDWYDALVVRQGAVDGALVVSVGDVAGQEHNAAAVMGPVRAVLRAFALEDPDPASILARLNRFVVAGYHDDTYVTAVVARYDPVSGALTLANAGHPAPLLIGADGVTTVSQAGPALGIFPDARFGTHTVLLEPGAMMCAYTDGLTDGRAELTSDAAHGQRLARVAAKVHERLPGCSAQQLLDEIRYEMGMASSRDDDACVIVVGRKTV